jgi:hypothetical protein
MPPRPRPTPRANQLDIIVEELNEDDANTSLESYGMMITERESQDQNFRDTEITKNNQEVSERLIAELNGEVIGGRTIATLSALRMEAIHSKDPLVRIRELQRRMSEVMGVDPEGGDPIVERLVADDANASIRFSGPSVNVGWCVQLLIPIIGTLALVVFGVLIETFDKSTASRPTRQDGNSSTANEPLDQTTFGHRLINLTSLTLEAAANLPGNFQQLGVSNACYAQFRKALVDQQQKLTENLWWQLLADQALKPFPQTDVLQTPANHYMALSLCLDILQPLYPPEPLDLDVDGTVDALASGLNLNDPGCMAAYYARVPDLIPEESGTNRAQRLFLARAGLARAFSRWQDPES